MAEEIDIAIVGAGPAGISTWLHLRDRAPELAKRSVVIEKSVHPREKICGGGVTWPGFRCLEALGVFVDVPAVSVDQVLFRSGSEVLRLGRGKSIGVVRRREFDDALLRVAIDFGMQCHQGVTLLEMDVGPGRIRLRTSRGELHARVVVGADGAQSTVRSLAGLDARVGLSRLLKAVVPREETDAGDEILFDFSPVADGLQGYVWRFPCIEGGRRAVDLGIFDSRVCPDRPRAKLPDLFETHSRAATRQPDRSSWLSHPVCPYRPGRPIARPRLILVGDAAGIDPILGEGISQSLRYGDVAAAALEDAFLRDDPSMEAYDQLLHDHALGRSLETRWHLARELYSADTFQTGDFLRLFRAWLLMGLP